MSLLIYFETNWIIGAVLGQDARADEFLSSPPSEIILAVPSVCIMEAISAFDWKRIERNQLKAELDRQLVQVQRSKQVPLAQQLATQLIHAKLTNDQLLNELFKRLDDLLLHAAQRAELIPLSADAIHQMVRLQRETELDRDDALILASILLDAKSRPPQRRGFLTGNIHDFEAGPVRNLLEQNEIKLLRSSEQALRSVAAE